MSQEMKDYWMRIVAAVFIMRMASMLLRDAEKIMSSSIRAKDEAVAASLNGNGVVTVNEAGEGTETQTEVEVALEDEDE